MASVEQLVGAPWPVLEYGTIDSTNAEALRKADDQPAAPYWVRAEAQTSGRGRLGRAWSSPQGNLFASAVFPYEGDLATAPLICFAAGLAVVDALQEIATADATSMVKLKWPNDVLVEDAKICGILIETSRSVSAPLLVVAGFGLNLATAPALDDRPSISVADLMTTNTPSPQTALTVLDLAFRRRLGQLLNEGFAPVRRDWLERTMPAGQLVSYKIGANPHQGEFVDLAEDGALAVRDAAGQIQYVRTGDVGLVG